MEDSQLIVDGLSNFEVLALKEQLKSQNVVSDKLSPAQIKKATGKQYEFVSTAILILNISNIAISAFKIWWLQKKKDKDAKSISVTIKLSNGTSIQINAKGEIEKIFFTDGTELDAANIKEASKEGSLKKLDAFTEIVGSVQDIFKELK